MSNSYLSRMGIQSLRYPRHHNQDNITDQHPDAYCKLYQHLLLF